jgi:DNA (cytosine-5)-methyltransferase 1
VNKPRRTHPVLYNEFDAYPAAWLRNLVCGGHIAPGVVDERSIETLTPEDVAGRRQFHAFAGIGVWSYALRLAGWPDDEPVWTGSCPCQPFSDASPDAQGFDDPRHLWPAWFRLIAACRPAVVFGE